MNWFWLVLVILLTAAVVWLTHNMQQAARVSDYTAMMMIDENRSGRMIEYDRAEVIFTRPKDKHSEEYVTGRFD